MSEKTAAATPGLSATFTWDYREQPPMENIAQRVRELSGGTLTMAMPETDSDEYELVITRQPGPDTATLLKRAADVLWACAKAALTVEPTLKQPYPDDPRWSPWTRWVERPAREAHDTAMAIRKHLKSDTGVKP